jgi:hypothetical protein
LHKIFPRPKLDLAGAVRMGREPPKVGPATQVPGGQPPGHDRPALRHPEQEGRVPVGEGRHPRWHLPSQVRVVLLAGKWGLLPEDPGVKAIKRIFLLRH